MKRGVDPDAPISGAFDCADQHPVGRLDVTVAVEQNVGRRDRRLQRSAEVRIGRAGVCEQLRRASQLPGHLSSDVGGVGKSLGSFGGLRT